MKQLAKYSGLVGIIVGSVLLGLSWLNFPNDTQLRYFSELGVLPESRLYFASALLLGAATSYFFFVNYFARKYITSQKFILTVRLTVIAQVITALLQADTNKPVENIMHWTAAFTFFGGLFLIVREVALVSFRKTNMAIWRFAKIYLFVYVLINTFLLLTGLTIMPLQALTLLLFWIWMIYLTYSSD